MKTCSSCSRSLELSMFGKNKSKTDGLQNHCKSCRSERARSDASKISEYQKQYREKNKDVLSQKAKSRYLSNSEEIKNRVKEYRKNNPEKRAASDRAWRLANLDRVNKNNKEWVAKNPSKRSEINKRYAQKHLDQLRIKETRRRAIKKLCFSLPYSREELEGKLIVWGNTCYLCNENIANKVSWDHVKPIAKGGPDILANLRPVHPACNSRKRDRWPVDIS